jgi:hypothetical protein
LSKNAVPRVNDGVGIELSASPPGRSVGPLKSFAQPPGLIDIHTHAARSREGPPPSPEERRRSAGEGAMAVKTHVTKIEETEEGGTPARVIRSVCGPISASHSTSKLSPFTSSEMHD